MGKDKTDTDLLCPNAQNDRKKSVDDKENSIETRKPKSKPIIKVRKDLTEVLEDENTNDSNTSTNSKSNKSSSTQNSSSTSKEDCTNNLKSTTKDLKNADEDTNNLGEHTKNAGEDTQKAGEDTNSISTSAGGGGGEKNTAPKLHIASSNPTEFKLRIVPLEQLLERPPKVATPPSSPARRTTRIKKENLPTEVSRRLPQRKSKPVSFIELSDSDEDEDDEDDDVIISSSSETDKRNKSKKQEASKKKLVKEESRKSAYKNHTDNKSSDSDSEHEPSRTRKSKRNLIKTPSETFDISSDSEEIKAKKSASKNKSTKKYSDSEEKKSKKLRSKRNSSESEEEEQKKSSKKETVKKSDTEKDQPSKRKPVEKTFSESVEEELSNCPKKKTTKKSDSEENKSKRPIEKSLESEGEVPIKSSENENAKTSDSEEDEVKTKQSNKKSADKSDSEEVYSSEPKRSLSKESAKSSPKKNKSTDSDTESSKTNSSKKAVKKASVPDENLTEQIRSSKRKRFEKSSESDEDESLVASLKRRATRKSSVSEKEIPKRKSSTRKSAEILSDTEIESHPKKTEPKRKSIKKSNSKSESEEDEPKKSDSKKKARGEPSEFDEDKPVKSKSTRKSKASGPPPSPSSIRRCVVRVKRSKLADFKDIGKSKSKRKMNGGTRSEKPSTSSARRRCGSSDDDSDFNYKRSGNIDERLADHDYDGHDVEDDDNDSQKSSDSEIIPTRKRRIFKNEKRDSSNSDSDFEPKQKEKKKKRRIRRNSSGDSDDDDDDEKKKSKRKDIRKIIKSDDLNLSTKEAAKLEEERRRRIEERQKIYNQIYEKPESAEVTELVLDFDPETKKALLEVDKGLMKKLKPHQVTGVKFMWDACFETINDAQEKAGSGCILAHCMGLGKTMQIVTLSHTLLCNSNKTNVERVLIISPLSTLNNWAREFKHWIGFTKKRNIEIYDMSKYKDKQTRIFKLNEWFEEGGVCILGYDMYRILTNEKAKGLRKKQREQLQQSLVNPGPDLVVCDEGHLLKNEKTSISKAVTRMRTLRRIVLTGTPLQNNLKEYYCMIQFIKPNLLGTYKEYLNRFVNPISNGQYTDSTDRDTRLMKHRSHILHKLLEGCIQRRDYSVLAPYLPPKHEYVVYTTLSTLQQLLYEHYMVHQRDLSLSASDGKGAKLFKDFQELRRIWTHPMNMRINSDSVIRKRILANDTDSMDDFVCDDDDEEDAASSSDSSANSSKSFGSDDGKGAAATKVVKTRNYRRNAAATGEDIDSDIEEVAEPPPQDDPSEWWKRFVADKELNNINHSPKLVMLMRLLEQCEAIGDKLLVFSQSLQSLDTIEHFLSLIDSKTRGYEYEGDVGEFTGFWSPGTDYFRLDGSCSVESRESMCKKFNDTSNLRSRLFLISTRAGGLGINLVSANRVVIFDVSWNPSHDTQSIFRVYRFGQDKPCYIYRLIAMGTMEQKLYERQVAKQATAKRVIDEQQISRHYNQSDLQELYTYELTPSTPREIPILPKDRLFAELLTEQESLLFKYHEHDSLLENEESENLSAEERKAAWSEYEAEKTRTVQTAQYMSYDRSAYGQFGNSSGSVTSNKIFGFRSDVLLQLLNMKITQDHPEMTQNQVIQVVPTYLNQLYSQMNSGDPSMYKDLLTLHATLVHPSGMYMNPLLYVNQNPSAAGYFQGGAPPANGMGVPVVGAPMGPPIVIADGPIPVPPTRMPAGAPAPGFDPNQVYEID